MESVLIKIAQSSSGTYTNLQTPSSFSLDWEDTDSNSYRSKANGNLIRNRLKPRWIKLELTYNKVTDSELNAIARAVNTNQKIYVRCKSPAFGNMDASGSTSSADKTWVQFTAYCSKYKADMIEGQLGWRVSFNIIQSEGASWQ